MPQFDPELIQLMRTVLEDAMTPVPLEISGTTTKAYLAEVILKAAAQGHTSYSDLITAATDQIHTLTSMLMYELADRDLKDHLAASLRTVPYGWVSDPAVCPCPHSPG
jgi:hypothetical protein